MGSRKAVDARDDIAGGFFSSLPKVHASSSTFLGLVVVDQVQKIKMAALSFGDLRGEGG
jgi:hypothetical protein